MLPEFRDRVAPELFIDSHVFLESIREYPGSPITQAAAINRSYIQNRYPQEDLVRRAGQLIGDDVSIQVIHKSLLTGDYRQHTTVVYDYSRPPAPRDTFVYWSAEDTKSRVFQTYLLAWSLSLLPEYEFGRITDQYTKLLSSGMLIEAPSRTEHTLRQYVIDDILAPKVENAIHPPRVYFETATRLCDIATIWHVV